MSHLLVQRAARGFRLRGGNLPLKCNSCNDDGWIFQAHTINASHQAFTSFLDVTISCAVQEQGVPSTAVPRVHLSPQRQQKNSTQSDPASMRGKCFYQKAHESNDTDMALTHLLFLPKLSLSL